MTKVLFHSVEEFVSELSREVTQPNRDHALSGSFPIDGKLVRRTIRRRYSDHHVRVSLMAGYRQGDSLTLLEYDAGDCFQHDLEMLPKLIGIAEHGRDQIDRVCRELGLEVRSGLIVPVQPVAEGA